MALAAVIAVTGPGGDARAQTSQGSQTSPHFGLPFETPPGVSTWYVSQFFGNTSFAYAGRDGLYAYSQGMHTGVDFGAPCGTPVVAIGDGIVVEVDNPVFGLVPHVLVVKHPEGYLSFYGHLLDAPGFGVGDPVTAGQAVGYVGDPDETCKSRPHLHLEIRDLSYKIAYNPVLLIDADWDTLALFGPFPPPFEIDPDHPRRWVLPQDQPDVQLSGAPANDYPRGWPPVEW